MTPIAVRLLARSSIAFAPLLVVASCGSSSPAPSTTAAEVAGPADSHCGSGATMTVQTVGACLTNDPPANTSSCGVTFAPDTAGGDDAGAPADDGGTVSDFGATLYNATGFDDDCKYQISWTASPVSVNANVTFTVTITRLDNMMPLHCAGVRAEVFLNDTHPAASPPTGASESSPGVYKVGPIKFDASGMWTVRFHVYEECSDMPGDSPHGHAAFYVAVP